ncbi:hypothetical protein BGZ61DRAFT_465347 [Ilyonectria robusta]|uniref:uncharacterized protein n=1 Tax=Ilyonectria robusta TaxID=1079257 RepID=UPI001E8DEB0B|nr:uncharacterized protein BGZ61DRAFT_465347 [Ilyonectria robusta]KAH8659440.1 hypothetical protein BGZ61DRAFT_465347 [Ilyonectria robusta]
MVSGLQLLTAERHWDEYMREQDMRFQKAEQINKRLQDLEAILGLLPDIKSGFVRLRKDLSDGTITLSP